MTSAGYGGHGSHEDRAGRGIGVGKRTLTEMLPPNIGTLQAKQDPAGIPAGGADVASLPTGSGRALPEAVRTKMERGLSADFSAVRVHESPQVAAMGARAFTRGTNIYFAPGQYAPDTPSGQELLGHELTHVVQQAQGRVQPDSEVAGMALNGDSSLEREADDRGAQAATGTQAATGGTQAATRTAVASHEAAEAPIQAQWGTAARVATGALGGVVVGGAAALLGAPALAAAGAGVLAAAAIGYMAGGGATPTTGGQTTNKQNTDTRTSGKDVGTSSKDVGTSSKDVGTSSTGEGGDEVTADHFGLYADQLRRRIDRRDQTCHEEIGYLQKLQSTVATLNNDCMALGYISARYEKMWNHLSSAAELRTSHAKGSAAIEEVLTNARGLIAAHALVIKKTIPEYRACMEQAADKDEEPLTRKKFGRLYGKYPRETKQQWQQQFAQSYAKTVTQLEQLEASILASYRALSGQPLDDALDDMEQLCEAREQVAADESFAKQARKGSHKSASPDAEVDDRKGKSLAPTKRAKRPSALTDASSNKTIQIVGADHPPNTGLTGSEQGKVTEFARLHGTVISGRLRDLMNERFGQFEQVNHWTIRISRGNRIEFDQAIAGNVITLTVKSIGKATYDH
jgi:hypothetical protein